MIRRPLLRSTILMTFLLVCLPGRTAEVPSEPMLRIDTGQHTATIVRIASDRDGRWLVSASQDKTVRVWDLATGRMLRVFRPPIAEGKEGELYSVAMSPDGRLVACGGWTELGSQQGFTIYIFARADGRMLDRIQGLPNTVGQLVFSPDGRMLAAMLGSGGMRLFAVEDKASNNPGAPDEVSFRQIADDPRYTDQSDGADFSPDSRQLATSSEDGFIRIYDLANLNMRAKRSRGISPSVMRTVPGGARLHGIRFSPDGSRVAVGFHHAPGVNILSVRDLHLLAAPDTSGVNNGDLSSVAWSRDGRFLYAAGLFARPDGVPILRWSAAGNGPLTLLLVGAVNTIMDMDPLSDGSLAFGAAGPTLAVLGPDDRLRWRVGPSIVDFRRNTPSLSQDGSKVGFGYAAGGAKPATFSLLDRALLTGTVDRSLAAPVYSAPGLDIRQWENSSAPTLNGKPLVLKRFDTSLSLAVAPDARSFVLGTEWYVRRFGRDGKEIWSVPAPSAVWGVNIARNGRVAVASCADGTIRWYRYSDGAKLAAFFPLADQRRWVVWTPAGYYDASPGGEELIGWHVNNGKDRAADFFPASRCREVRYRPDVVRQMLQTLDEAKAVRLADSQRETAPVTMTIAQALPPVITITDPEDGSRVSTNAVTLHYLIRTPSGQPVTAVRALVNGRPVATNRGVRLAENKGEGDEVTVAIPPRDCEVSLIAENRLAASVPATIHLTWSNTVERPEFIAKPVLYIVAAGISAYQKPDLRLGYAAKDARDFAAAMEAQKGGLYRDVVVKLLTDASKGDIEDGLDWLQHQVTSRDVGMIFLAGHGVDDSNGVYYFLPANVDLEHLKRTGLVFSDIKNTVSAIAGKAVMFVDTCHSGDVLGARRGVPDINEVVNELASAENGVVVFTASTGSQYSLEDPKWQNGAFTKALVEGIKGKADYGGNGEITINMLDLYLAERVKQLTNGEQTPATSKPSTVPDFPVAVKVTMATKGGG